MSSGASRRRDASGCGGVVLGTPTREPLGRGSLRSPAERVAVTPNAPWGLGRSLGCSESCDSLAALAAEGVAPRSLLGSERSPRSSRGTPTKAVKGRVSRCPRTPPSRVRGKPGDRCGASSSRPRAAPPVVSASPPSGGCRGASGGGGAAAPAEASLETYSALLFASLAAASPPGDASPPPPPPPPPSERPLDATLRSLRIVASPAGDAKRKRSGGKRASDGFGSDEDVFLPDHRPPWRDSPRREKTGSALDRFLAFESHEPQAPGDSPRVLSAARRFSGDGSDHFFSEQQSTPVAASKRAETSTFETPPTRRPVLRAAPPPATSPKRHLLHAQTALRRPRPGPPEAEALQSSWDTTLSHDISIPSLLGGASNKAKLVASDVAQMARAQAKDPVAAALRKHDHRTDGTTLIFTADVANTAGAGHSILKPRPRRTVPANLFSPPSPN